jgi:hypothetical protein
VPPASLDRDRRRFWRWSACGFLASALHCGALLIGLYDGTPLTLVAHAAAADELVEVDVEMPAPGQGQAPGGGSPEADPNGAEQSTPEQPKDAVVAARAVPRAERKQDVPALSETIPEEPKFDPTPPPPSDVLTSAFSATDPLLPEPLVTKPARDNVLEARTNPTATAPDVARQHASTSRSVGYGPGAHTGPGGPGRGSSYGNGVVKQRFAFGGPTGAFRADVCFIESTVRRIADIKQCPRVVTFFTDVLNVPPRRFTEGFPGVSDRIEWFAIRYTGRFTVTAADYYTFRLVSDDGAILYIDGHEIIDNDGQHPPAMRRATIQLEAGEHRLFVSYFQGPRENIALQLFVAPSGGAERLLGPVL